MLAWVFAIDPAEHLAFLRFRQAARSSGSAPRAQDLRIARRKRRPDPPVNAGAIESVRGNHVGRILAFAHPFDRHQADLFQRLVIQLAAVALHSPSKPQRVGQ